MAQSKIDQEVTNIGITNNNGNHWYFYALLLDGKPCAKFGKSTVHLGKRIYSYLEKEHSGQTKDWSTFRLICAIKFKKKSCIKHVEGLIKEHAKDHPLHSNQHFNTEQYDLPKVWEQIREFIIAKSFPFAEKVYLAKNPDEAIQKIVSQKKQTQKKTNKPIKSKAIISVKQDIIQKGKDIAVYHPRKQKQMTSTELILKYLNETCNFSDISGIGPVLSDRLNYARPFYALHDIMDVHMIGQMRYNAIVSHVKGKAFDYICNHQAID